MNNSYKAISIAILVVGVSLLHYFTELRFHLQHVVYRELYFFPIFLAGFWFGLKGALITSFCITGIYLPFLIISWTGLSPESLDNLFQVLLFNIVAGTVGRLVDRQRAENDRRREAETMAAMGRAASALAHDIRTPLIAIGGFSRLVREKLSIGDPRREKLDIVIQETRRLENMLTKVLDFSRPLELHLHRGDINQAMMRSLSVVAGVAKDKQVRLESCFSEDIPEISFDRERMEQAFINILMNAVQASPKGETVLAASHRLKTHVEVEIKDNGRGIPAENKDKLFLPFFTTKKNGTGLGLAVVKKIIDAHGGSLEVADNQPTGTIFKVRLLLR